MAKIDLNAVLDGHDNPRVGDEYEIAPGKWGKMKPPTQGLQDKAIEYLSRDAEEQDDLELARMVLSGDLDFAKENAIPGVVAKAVQDFFTLLLRTVKVLNPESAESSQQSAETAP